MSKEAVRERFAQNYVSIVLTLHSIIQGLAFSNLLLKLEDIYKQAPFLQDWNVLAHFFLCFILILRVFQTYTTAALDYVDWRLGFFDLFTIFLIGAAEYSIFSTLSVKEFSVVPFYQRFSILSGMGVVGYLAALVRIKRLDYQDETIYQRERQLQLANIAGLLWILLISSIILCWEIRSSIVYAWFGLAGSLVLSINIVLSLRVTFWEPLGSKENSKSDSIQEAGAASGSRSITEPTTIISPLNAEPPAESATISNSPSQTVSATGAVTPTRQDATPVEYPLRQSDLIEAVNKRIHPLRINSYDVQCVARVHGIRANPSFCKPAEGSDGPAHYSQLYVEWLVEQINVDRNFIAEARM